MVESFENSQGRASMISADKVKELSCQYWLSSSEKAHQLLGYEPVMPIVESLRETYNWYVENRLI
jgi:nucleoside-diphosphate-sugar epimerase